MSRYPHRAASPTVALARIDATPSQRRTSLTGSLRCGWRVGFLNIVILTGAGISQESGLSTFRGGGGLWEDHQVDDVSTAKALQKNPDLVYRFFDERRAALDAVEPNLAHMALSKLEWHWREGRKGSFLLITQNVDDLHERAGSAELIHMHGMARWLAGPIVHHAEETGCARTSSYLKKCPTSWAGLIRP